jgi:hypothetical protein
VIPKALFLIGAAFTSCGLLAMDGNDVGSDNNSIGLFNSCQNKPYHEFRSILMAIVPQLGIACTLKHNPLPRSYGAQDYELTKVLLLYGANPLKAFEANNAESNKEDCAIAQHTLASKAEMSKLLEKYKEKKQNNLKSSEPFAWLKDNKRNDGWYRLFVDNELAEKGTK